MFGSVGKTNYSARTCAGVLIDCDKDDTQEQLDEEELILDS